MENPEILELFIGIIGINAEHFFTTIEECIVVDVELTKEWDKINTFLITENSKCKKIEDDIAQRE